MMYYFYPTINIMKDLLKIKISHIRVAIETYEHTTFTDEEWQTGLFGWRMKYHYHSSKVNKGWLTRKETLKLAKYFITPYVNIAFGEKGFFIF